MELIPTSPGEAEQACPFCDDELVEKGESKGSVLPAADRYVEISLAGDKIRQSKMLDAFGPEIDPRGSWYDEMVVRVIALGVMIVAS